MLPYVVVVVFLITTYSFLYVKMLVPEVSLIANQDAILRIRHKRYSFDSGLIELLFSPISFLDFLVRPRYWIQGDVSEIGREHLQFKEYLSSLTQVAAKGGIVIWDSDKIMVSYMKKAIIDEDLKVFEEFVLVEDLEIGATGVSDAGLEHLLKLKQLRHLNVDGTQVTDGAIESFKRRMPDCFVWNAK